MMNRSFDWDENYQAGRQIVTYPWDVIISFVFRNAPRDKPRSETLVVELGCGTGSNLWFAAREGFKVFGIDISATAIEVAKQRFKTEGLSGDFKVGDFRAVPLPDGQADIVLDRGALTHVSLDHAKSAIAEARRLLRPGGLFFFNPFSSSHSSCASGRRLPNGFTVEIQGGALKDNGPVCFWGRNEIDATFSDGWELRSVSHAELVDQTTPHYGVQSDWRVIAVRR